MGLWHVDGMKEHVAAVCALAYKAGPALVKHGFFMLKTTQKIPKVYFPGFSRVFYAFGVIFLFRWPLQDRPSYWVCF